MTREEVKAQFAKDVADHKLTIMRDDGLYRHLRLKRPGTMNHYFDIITWPGYLAYVGDMGDYVLTRVLDMFTFFRGHTPNPNYWGEKCVAVDKNSGLEAFSKATFRAGIEEDLRQFIEHRYPDPDPEEDQSDEERTAALAVARKARKEALDALQEALEDDVFPRLDDDRDGRAASQAAMDVKDSKGHHPFETIYEYKFTEWTFRFLWCCHAIPWAIAQYDAQKAQVAT